MRLRMFIFSACFMMACVTVSEAIILASESFDYATGDIGGNAGGTGWGTNAWTGNSSTDISAGSLSYTDVETNGNKFVASWANEAKRFFDTSGSGNFTDYVDANSDIGADGTVLWMGCIADVNDNIPRPINLYRGGSSIFKVWADGGEWQLIVGATYTYSGISTSAAPEFLLLKVNFASGDQDTVRVWINHDLTDGEPAEGTEDIVDSGFNAAFDQFGSTFGGGSVSFMDELRIADSFKEVYGNIAPGTVFITK